jgi:hypothetical protein
MATKAVLDQLEQFHQRLLRTPGITAEAAEAVCKLFNEHTKLARQYASEFFQGEDATAKATLDTLVNVNGKAMHEALSTGQSEEMAARIGKTFMEHLTTTATYIAALKSDGVKSVKFWETVWIAVETGRKLGMILDQAYPLSA